MDIRSPGCSVADNTQDFGGVVLTEEEGERIGSALGKSHENF